MSKENLANSPKRLERFIYRWGHLIASELKTLLEIRSIGVKVVVLGRGSKSVLLVRHGYRGVDQWYLPGGGVHSGERPDEAISRELSEEVILDAERPVLAGIYKSKGKGNDLTFLFGSQAQREDVKTVPVAEIEEARFFPLTRLPENLAPGVEERVSEVVKGVSQGSLGSSEVIWGEW